MLSQYMEYMKIVYRKGSKNDSDALSRREDLAKLTEESIIGNPVLKKKFEDYDAGIFGKELEDLRESLTEMTHLQCDNPLITERDMQWILARLPFQWNNSPGWSNS
jgi:hypothetical protein